MTKVVRMVPIVFLPYIFFSPQAPIASRSVWSTSAISGKGRACFSLNFWCDAAEMLKWQRDNLLPTARFYSMSEEERAGKKQIGILSFNDYPEYTEEYAKIIAACRKKAKKEGGDRT